MKKKIINWLDEMPISDAKDAAFDLICELSKKYEYDEQPNVINGFFAFDTRLSNYLTQVRLKKMNVFDKLAELYKICKDVEQESVDFDNFYVYNIKESTTIKEECKRNGDIRKITFEKVTRNTFVFSLKNSSNHFSCEIEVVFRNIKDFINDNDYTTHYEPYIINILKNNQQIFSFEKSFFRINGVQEYKEHSTSFDDLNYIKTVNSVFFFLDNYFGYDG